MLQRIGRYEILDRVASGGQGTVYRARDTVLDRIVAVKVINQSTEDDPAYLEALQREARLAARLDHPNITRVHDFQVEDGVPYIVMEFVPDALDRQLRGNERLPWRRAVEIGLQTSRALQHAHEQGVVHRDIKPQNILLRETGAAAVSDFGIARAFASSTRSQTAGVMGTPAYMAPEQWAGGAVDGRLDQYGLGIVLYEIITGSPPFQGDSMEALYVQHREAPVPPISSSLQVPDEVERVIRKTLEKSPGDRYGSASELADALEGALTGGAAQGPRTEVSPPQRREPARPEPAEAAPPSRPPQPPAPPRQPAASGAGSGRSGGIPSWLLFGGLGAAVIAVVAIVISLVTVGNSGSVLAPSPTPITVKTYIPYETPTPFPSSTPEPLTPTATPERLPPTATPERLPPTPTPKMLSPTSTPASLQTTKTFKKNKREIVFGGLDWTSALVQNGVARYIVEHGYGYPTSQIEGSTLPLFQGLRKGDIDITMEIWLPNQAAAWNEAVKAGEVLPVGKSLEDNWQSSFLIPKYMQDANPDLDSVEDLKEDKFKDLFEQEGGKVLLLGCIAGWGCRTMQDGDYSGPGQIVGMGLEDHVVLVDPGTSGSLAAAIEGAFAKKDPILFYYWGPTALALKLETEMGGIVDLEQPHPSECVDNSPIHGCSFPPAEVMIALNTELVDDAPELISFFKNWDWNAGNQLAAEYWHATNSVALANKGASSEEIFSATGVWYLKNNDEWENWVPDDVVENVLQALSKE